MLVSLLYLFYILAREGFSLVGVVSTIPLVISSFVSLAVESRGSTFACSYRSIERNQQLTMDLFQRERAHHIGKRKRNDTV